MRNRSCHCPRCRARALMGPAILITFGVLWLLQEYLRIRVHETWPVLLIVIGLISYASRTASLEGHVQPWWMGGTQPPPSGQSNPSGTGVDPQVKP
ncbi:MAG TPA: DUF5668 domain-containing protein [Candidatus Angelobacter sp.]